MNNKDNNILNLIDKKLNNSLMDNKINWNHV